MCSGPDFIMCGRKIAPIIFSLLLIGDGGCAGPQSSLNPAGEQASEISRLWWIFLGVMGFIYFLVVFFTFLAVRRHQNTLSPPDLQPDPDRERNLTIALGGFMSIIVIILFYFMVSDFLTGRKMRALTDPHPLRILITAHQWWWEVQYENEIPSNIVTTANEIHLPLGKAVRFDLQSPDVIHSFWAPNFDGKRDIVPGHPTSLWFRPTRMGTFYGQCAEFCGLQHAHMRFVILVETPEQFTNWLNAASQTARAPATEQEKHGEEVFLKGSCIVCHTISGTPARGTVGPDLTHLASRLMLGAGTLPNTRGHLGGWILDAPRIKPGVRMPQNSLSPADFQALLAYLGNLK